MLRLLRELSLDHAFQEKRYPAQIRESDEANGVNADVTVEILDDGLGPIVVERAAVLVATGHDDDVPANVRVGMNLVKLVLDLEGDEFRALGQCCGSKAEQEENEEVAALPPFPPCRPSLPFRVPPKSANLGKSR